MDMSRCTHLLAGAFWTAEFGAPDAPEQWALMETPLPLPRAAAGSAVTAAAAPLDGGRPRPPGGTPVKHRPRSVAGMSESIPFSPVPADEEGVIHVSAVVLADAAGRVLQVRKTGTEAFMFPGGKPEAGETYLLAAVRELAEETALTLAPADLASLGLRRTSAANEDGFGLAAAVYVGPVLDDEAAAAVTVHDEIEELAWVAPGEVDDEGGFPGGRLAPLSAEVLRERA